MPKIPQYDSRVSLTKAPPAAQARQINPAAAGEAARGMQDVGRALSAVGERFKRLRDLHQEMTATTEVGRQLDDIYTRSVQDPDPYNTAPYEEEIQTLSGTAGSQISDPETRLRFQMEFDNAARTTRFKMQRDFEKRQIAQGKVDLLEAIEEDGRQYRNATRPEEKRMILDRLDRRINNGLRVGIVPFDQTKGLKESSRKEFVMGEVQQDISDALKGDGDFQGVIERLDSGWYEQADIELTFEEKAELRDQALKFEKKRREEEELQGAIAQEQREQAFTERLMNGDMNLVDINQAEVTAGASKEWATAARRYASSATAVDPVTKADVYNRLSQEYFTLGIEKNKATEKGLGQLAHFRAGVIEESAKGTLDNGLRNTWLKAIGKNYEEAIKDIADQRPWWQRLMFWADDFVMDDFEREEAKAHLSSELMSQITNNDLPAARIPEVAQKILADYIGRTHPEVLGLDGIPNEIGDQGGVSRVFQGTSPVESQVKVQPERQGQLMQDAQGNRAIVYPDGTIQELD